MLDRDQAVRNVLGSAPPAAWAACVWVTAFLLWLIVMAPALLRGVPRRVEAVRT